MKTFSLAIAAAAILGTGHAAAASITETFDFEATGFSVAFGPPAPTDPVTGSFTITFDPTVTYTDATAGITLNSINLAVGSPVAFTYSPTGPAADEIFVGGSNDDAMQVQYGTNDFYLHVLDFTTNPTFQQLGYTTADGYYYTPAPTSGGIAAAPEPATWALMALGVGVAGASLRRLRQGRASSTAVA